ncbi:unnamed protein product, partial [Brachionus calyciflorus]
DLPKSYSSHKNCVICRMNCGKLHIIQSEARTQVLLSRNIFIPVGCRTCRVHLNESGLFKVEHLDLLEIEKIETKINRKTANDLIQTLIDTSKKKRFSMNSLILLKLTQNYLDEVKASQIRTKSQALAIYLFWLKTGMSQNAIKAHFRLNDRIEVSRYCEQVRSSLSSNFVPEFLGTEVMNRQEWLQQNTPLAKEFFSLKDDDYSVQKKRSLVKPFLFVAANGRILNAFGAFPASKNDAKIIKMCFSQDKDLENLLRKGDGILVDRGFRDSFEYLENKELRVMMPAFIAKDRKQLTCQQANHSRLVTKCRWVTEAINGTLKESFRALGHVQNSMLKHIMIDFRISCALINRFFQPKISDKENGIIIARNMKAKISQTENEL